MFMYTFICIFTCENARCFKNARLLQQEAEDRPVQGAAEGRGEAGAGHGEQEHRGGPQAAHPGRHCAHHEDAQAPPAPAAHLRGAAAAQRPLQAQGACDQGETRHTVDYHFGIWGVESPVA